MEKNECKKLSNNDQKKRPSISLLLSPYIILSQLKAERQWNNKLKVKPGENCVRSVVYKDKSAAESPAPAPTSATARRNDVF